MSRAGAAREGQPRRRAAADAAAPALLSDGQFEYAAGDHEQGMQKAESLRIHPARAIYHGVRSAWNAERLHGALFLLEGQAIKLTLEADGVARYGVGADDGRVAEMLRQ